MGFIAAFFGSMLGGVVGAVGAIAAGIASAFAGVAFPVAAAVGGLAASIAASMAAAMAPVVSAVGAITASIASTMAAAIAPLVAAVSSIAGTVTSALSSIIGEVVATVGTTIHSIVTSLGKALKDAAELIDATTKPILEPIREGWQTIHDYIETIKEGIKDKLQPLEDVADIVNTIRDVKILGKILTGSEGIAKVVRYAEDLHLLDMAAAVSTLYNMTAQTITGILEKQEAERKTFEEKIRYIDQGMRNLIELTQSKTLATVYDKVHEVSGKLVSLITDIDVKVAAIGRRTEDLPWFQEMLLRALP